MRVSLNLIKKYVDLPKDITDGKLAYDMTLRTVEVDEVINFGEKFHDIVVGKILEVKPHPNADKLRICITDIGLDEPVQIVCGGSNLYIGEYVVVCKPGAVVVWHGEGEPVKIEKTKMRGEESYGMICASEEVFLSDFFPQEDSSQIIDLKGIPCEVGQNIADVLDLNDTVLEIDNKSLSNRPDLWGYFGLARELSAIYNVSLKEINKINVDKNLEKYSVEIKNTSKCSRYAAIEIDGIYEKKSPIWMQAALVKCGLRPINAIVDITNYVMITTGEPLHAFDKTHITGDKIIVRDAKDGEELLLLDNNSVALTKDDLVICDAEGPLALAGIKGGLKDSILPDTKKIVLEAATFSASSIRKSSKRFAEKTDASMRFEKGIDTQRVDDALNLALTLIKEIFPDSKIIKYNDVCTCETKRNVIKVEEKFLTERLGKKVDSKVIMSILTSLGYDVTFTGGIYTCIVPTYRSTGDVTIKDDVMGDIARILSYDSFEAKPITITFDNFVNQRKVLLENRIMNYLAKSCGFYEIFTYPWVDEKYINAVGIDTTDAVYLATPPAPELSILRKSLIPGMMEAISKNLRYFDEFKIFELSGVYKKGDYRPSCDDEILPLQNKNLCGAIVGVNALEIFYELKGILESLAREVHMETLELKKLEKPSWADVNAYVNIVLNDEVIGILGLVSVKVLNECKIKKANIAMFELNFDKLIPFLTRDNKYEKLPELPLVEKDLSVIVDEDVSWDMIKDTIKNKVKEVVFTDVYRGSQIEKGKKSITLKLKMINEGSTMTSDEINEKMKGVLKSLEKRCGAKIRDE